MKTIIIQNQSNPATLGYNDRGTIVDNDSIILWHGSISAQPNPDTKTRKYGRLAYGEYSGQLIPAHPTFGRCILIENGRELPSLVPNSAHGNRNVMTEIFVHKGDQAQWRGSAGCITVPPISAIDFFCNFLEGEKMKIVLVDYHTKD